MGLSLSHRSATIVALFGTLVAAGCGGSASSPSSPSSTSSSNTSPVIAAMSVSPSFGVSGLSTFAMAASATDANGDSLTYTWTLGTATLTGASVSGTIAGDGAVTVRLTVVDGKGGSATDTRTVTIGTLSGTWDVVVPNSCGSDGYSSTLTQSGAIATGSFLFSRVWCNVPAGSTALTDPAEPGTITAAGAVNIRVKVGFFTDFYMRGTMGTTGRVITGGIFNSGWSGQNFTATKR